MAARDVERGRETADALGGRFVQLDVTSDASVAGAVERVAAVSGRLDVLVNNAGITGVRVAVADLTAEDVRNVFETNLFGVVRVTRAFLPLLERSDNPVVVNVSSGMGSLHLTTDPSRLEFDDPRPGVHIVQGRAEHAHDAVCEGVPRDPLQRG